MSGMVSDEYIPAPSADYSHRNLALDGKDLTIENGTCLTNVEAA
jgi:hypothetical protein